MKYLRAIASAIHTGGENPELGLELTVKTES